MDRNSAMLIWRFAIFSSPPARVAWIETLPAAAGVRRTWVATREGGVDRNLFDGQSQHITPVATREGGVDRNPCGKRSCRK